MITTNGRWINNVEVKSVWCWLWPTLHQKSTHHITHHSYRANTDAFLPSHSWSLPKAALSLALSGCGSYAIRQNWVERMQCCWCRSWCERKHGGENRECTGLEAGKYVYFYKFPGITYLTKIGQHRRRLSSNQNIESWNDYFCSDQNLHFVTIFF